jgi:hypothetical protein
MAKKIPTYYYRIYDDKEQFNYFKSTLGEKTIRKLLKRYEKVHQEYYNAEFLKFLREHDKKAEMIDLIGISY